METIQCTTYYGFELISLVVGLLVGWASAVVIIYSMIPFQTLGEEDD